jgi:hypothetical protein
MKPRNFYWIIVGGVFILSDIASILLSAGEAIIGAIFLAAVFAFLITGISPHRKNGDDPESDKRSKEWGIWVVPGMADRSLLYGRSFLAGLSWHDPAQYSKRTCSIDTCPCTLCNRLQTISLPEKEMLNNRVMLPYPRKSDMNKSNSRNPFSETICRPR